MTVTNVKNTMPTSPNINARLTAFGFGLTPEGTFSNLVTGSIYQWAFTNFPAFQRVDVCLASGSGCAGGGTGGLNQGQVIARNLLCDRYRRLRERGHGHADSREISNQPRVPGDRWGRDRPATVGCERPHHYEDAQPRASPSPADSHVHRDGLKRRELAVERRGDRDRDAAAGPDDYGALWHRLDLHSRNGDLHSKRRARPGASYPAITVAPSVGLVCAAWNGDEHRRRFRRRRLELDQ